MKLPTYEESESRVFEGSDSSVDWFVVEHEPAHGVAEDKFRRELQDLIDFVEAQAHKVPAFDPDELQCEPDWVNEHSAFVVAGGFFLFILLVGVLMGG